MKVTVYTKPACVQCNATYRALDKAGIDYQVIDMSTDLEAYEYVRSLNYKQAPMVQVTYGPTRIETWAGFRPDLINELKEKNA